MKKLNTILTIAFIVILGGPALAQSDSVWPTHESYSRMYPNPGQRGFDYILTKTKSMKADQGFLALTPVKVVDGQGVDAGGALLKYRTYTQCYMSASQIENRGRHNAFTLKPGHRFLTVEEQAKYADASGEDFVKKIVDDTIPYKYEFGQTFVEDSIAPGLESKAAISELKNFCLTNATATRINPGYCRILNFKWKAGFDALNKQAHSYLYSELVYLNCERSSVIVFESNKANFEVSPALVKKTYHITNQEANALLASADIKLVKALPENIRSK
jgi:hypothetical protein